MDLRLEILTEDQARQICSWKYEGIYSVYNFPDWDTLIKQRWGITLREKRKNEFTAVIDKSNNLCGYIRFIENKDFVLVGLGLKPSLCGQGLGNILMEVLKSECKKRYGSKKIALEVRSFNKRAIKCYEKAGFVITDIYQKDTLIGSDEFIKMEYK
jgi:ribosomal protein S18 acetylase RimI-like enzyme